MAAMDGWSAWPAPAKLNLMLRITGRRADGYHALQTVFQLLDWGDVVHVRTRADGRIRRLQPVEGVDEADDLAVRAAAVLREASGCRLGADLRIDKRIPVGGGFGGGSSDAATVLRVLDRLWDTRLGPQRLAELGLGLGADVPVFVHGHSAWAEGVGEQLAPIRLRDRTYLLLDSGVGVATGTLFQAPDLTRDAAPLTISEVESCEFPETFGNAFEPVLRAQAPQVDEALQALSRFGRACLTGTGGGCFVGFDSRPDAQAAAAGLASRHRVWTASGVQRSPLLRALDAWQAIGDGRQARDAGQD